MDNIMKQYKNTSPNKNRIKGHTLTVILISLSVILILATIIVFNDLISDGANALYDSFKSSYEEQKNNSYREYYTAIRENAEKKYHVTNRVSIYIGNIQEEQKLEVLKVSDTEYVISDGNDNDANAISWLEMSGEGTFVVDLKAGEYIIDNQHSHVMVRIPEPELAHIQILKITPLLQKNGKMIGNGSYQEGEDLARQQQKEGEILIKKELTSNQHFYISAQNAAESMIKTLIKELNPDVEKLTVDVEFY